MSKAQTVVRVILNFSVDRCRVILAIFLACIDDTNLFSLDRYEIGLFDCNP